MALDSNHFARPKSLASDGVDGPALQGSLARLSEVKPRRKAAPNGRDELPLVRASFDTQRNALTFPDEPEARLYR